MRSRSCFCSGVVWSSEHCIWSILMTRGVSVTCAGAGSGLKSAAASARNDATSTGALRFTPSPCMPARAGTGVVSYSSVPRPNNPAKGRRGVGLGSQSRGRSDLREGRTRLLLLLSRRPLRLELTLSRVLDDLAEDPSQLLGRVKSHRVLGRDEVEPPLRLALLDGGRLQRSLTDPALLRGHDRVEHVGRGLGRALEQRVVAILDREHARLQLLLGDDVAGLTGAIQVQER